MDSIPQNQPDPQPPDDTTRDVWQRQGDRCVCCNADPQLVRERGEELTSRREPLGARR